MRDDFGTAVAAAGDVNADGHPDFIVGASGAENNGRDSGSAKVYSGKDGAILYHFLGNNPLDYFGVAVSGCGDVNRDGFDDVIVGADGEDTRGSRAGMATVFSGKDGSGSYSVAPEGSLWTNLIPESLGILGDCPPGSSRCSSSGEAINNLNQIVGREHTKYINEAMIYDCGRMQQLNNMLPEGHGSFWSGWLLLKATDISNTGHIIGIGRHEDRSYVCVAFLLEPHLPFFGPDPGVAGTNNLLRVRFADPGKRLVLFSDLPFAGSPLVSPLRPIRSVGCLKVIPGFPNPHLTTSATVDPQGTAEFQVVIPASLSGKTVNFQAFEASRCRLSNVIRYEFL